MNEIFFATRNKGKLQEARHVLLSFAVKVIPLRIKKVELQEADLGRIAVAAIKRIPENPARCVMVEDSGLFVDGLNGFPGPYSSYVLKTIGILGLLKLVGSSPSRSAEFRSALAFRSYDGVVKLFRASVRGTLAEEPRGSSGFGFDPIFIYRGEKLTFGEMSLQRKCGISHRGKALTRLGRWYTSNLAGR